MTRHLPDAHSIEVQRFRECLNYLASDAYKEQARALQAEREQHVRRAVEAQIARAEHARLTALSPEGMVRWSAAVRDVVFSYQADPEPPPPLPLADIARRCHQTVLRRRG